VFNVSFDNRDNPKIIDRIVISIEKNSEFKHKKEKENNSGQWLIR
jgi:hypothetical protein